MISIFRGKFALVLKIIILALVTAILSLLAQSAFASGQIAIGSFLVISIVALNFAYFTKVSIPLKFFIPGILLFIAFVIGPIVFTVIMSLFNYKTGNYLVKDAAIEQVSLLTKPFAFLVLTFSLFHAFHFILHRKAGQNCHQNLFDLPFTFLLVSYPLVVPN